MSDKVDVISQDPIDVEHLISDAKDKVAKAYSMLIADNNIPDWEPISINVVVGQLNSTTKATRTFTFTSRDRPRDVLDGIIGHINTFNHDKKVFDSSLADDLFTDISELLEQARSIDNKDPYSSVINELDFLVKTWEKNLGK